MTYKTYVPQPREHAIGVSLSLGSLLVDLKSHAHSEEMGSWSLL